MFIVHFGKGIMVSDTWSSFTKHWLPVKPLPLTTGSVNACYALATMLLNDSSKSYSHQRNVMNSFVIYFSKVSATSCYLLSKAHFHLLL